MNALAPGSAGNYSQRPVSRTEALIARTHELLAYGGRHQMMLRPLYEDEQGVFPEFAEHARGYEVTDTNGRIYVDWLSAWGPVLLGYRHPEVEDAIKEQLSAGPLLSLSHPIETEVASMLVDMVPCAEMVAFGKNGSDVVTAAVRIARASTGRELILQYGFHGFHDWYTCLYRTQNVKGVSTALRAFVQSFPYNDLDALESLFRRYPGEVAAVVMEPVVIDPPSPGYLEGVRDLAHRHGALLVFDEMVTGFRLANGGAQELYGVTPDLACFGKALANGMPLAAIVGAREHMRHLPSTSWGMTFRGETLSLAAARAVLRVLDREPVVEHLARIGEELRTAFHDACELHGVRCELRGPPARMTFVFDEEAGIPAEALRRLFVLECARRGVLTRAGIMPSYAHDSEAVERAMPAFRAGLAAVARAVGEAHETVVTAMRTGFDPPPEVAADGDAASLPDCSIDAAREQGGALELTGWLLLEDGRPEVIELVAPGGEIVLADPAERSDLAEAFPAVAGAGEAGFFATLPVTVFAPSGDFEFEIRARRGSEIRFRCRVTRGRDRGATHPGPSLEADGTLRL